MRLDLRVSDTDVERAVGNMLLVQEAWVTAQSSINVSELELNRAVERMHEKLQASIVAIRADAMVDEKAEFDGPTLQAQFTKYREQLRGSGPLDFGYMHPDRLKVEYVKIDTGAIALQRDIPRKVAENYWLEHKSEFPKPPSADGGTKDQAADQAEPQEEVDPAEPAKEESPYYENFADVQDLVMQRLRKQKQLEIGRQMAEILRQRLSEDWFNAKTGPDGYPVTPSGVDRPDYYKALVDSQAPGLESPQCISIGSTGFFSQAEAPDQVPMGGSRRDGEMRGLDMLFGDDLLRVQGLEERSPDEPAGASGPVALFQTAPPVMIDDENNLYLYRIIAVERAHAPASLDEVRDQVVRDLRRKQAYDRAVEQTRLVHKSIGDAGLPAAWEAFTGLPPDVKTKAGSAFEAAPFARSTGTASPIVVRDKSAREENTILSEQFISKVYALLEAEGPRASGVIEVPELNRVFVVQLSGLSHLTPAEFKEKKQQVLFRVMQDRLEPLKQAWFDSNRIRARANFAFLKA
jgi:hypothetical protein